MGLTTVTFPVQPLKDNNTLQIILELNNSVENNALPDPYGYGIAVVGYGKLDIEYDMEDAFLVPSTYSLSIIDKSEQKFLIDLLFDDVDNHTPGGNVILKYNGVQKFKGVILEETLTFDDATKTFEITAAPRIDAITKRMIYDDEDANLNPFDYAPLYFYPIRTILSDIYSLANDDVAPTLDFVHSWELYGERDYQYDGTTIHSQLNVEDAAQLIDPLFFDSSFGLRTCGDVLKKLAIDWGAFTGLISQDKAFFKKLFRYDGGNLQNVTVLNRSKGYRYHLIDYVKVTTNIGGTNEPYEAGVFTELVDRFIIRKSLPGFYSDDGGNPKGTNVKLFYEGGTFNFYINGSSVSNWPTLGTTYTATDGSTFVVIGVLPGSTNSSRIHCAKMTGGNPPTSGILTKSQGSGDPIISYFNWDNGRGWYKIYRARDLSISADFMDHGQLLADFWLFYRGAIKFCRVDKFMLDGVDYDYLKDFNYDGSKYQPIKQTIDYEAYSTTMQAIYLGE